MESGGFAQPRDTARAMSKENLKSSRKAWDRFLDDDMDGLLALLDPEVEVHDPPELPGATIHHGHEG
jgi:hypothetical protein